MLILLQRQGAFVLDQILPKPEYGIKSREDQNKNVSLWDLMHPQAANASASAAKTYQKPAGAENGSSKRNERRDPIGYFDDTKYGGSLGNGQSNPTYANGSPEAAAAQRGNYQPTWGNESKSASPLGGNGQSETANELLDRAMTY
jgi:hypothetical protein